MKSRMMWVAVILAVMAVSGAWAQTGSVTVLNDRVNLRAKPRAEAEVVGQVNTGTILEIRGTNGDWIAVTPPEAVGLWVFSEFVKDGKVATDKLNVRAGAGINYPVVGSMAKDEPVVGRKSLGEWLEIAPPSTASLWVHKDYVTPLVEPSTPPAVVPVVSEPVVVAAIPVVEVATPEESNLPPSVEPVVEAPAPPPDLNERGLVPLDGQGEVMEGEGVLLKTSMLDFSRVSDYCLVDRQRGRPVTVCYIRGNRAQLKELEGRRLKVKGEGYWVKGSAKAVIVPKQITPLADKP